MTVIGAVAGFDAIAQAFSMRLGGGVEVRQSSSSPVCRGPWPSSLTRAWLISMFRAFLTAGRKLPIERRFHRARRYRSRIRRCL